MNLKLTLILLLTIVQFSWAQECDFEIRILSNKLSGETNLIEKSEYDNAGISGSAIELKPMSELELTKKYPKIFKLKDSCLIYISELNDNNKLCKNRVQTKEYSDYTLKGIYSGFALIETIGYESWGFISVDLKNGLSFYTMGKPLTSNGETSIAYSNYYGEEEISLTDLKTKKSYVIGIEGWRTVESKVFENIYYLKLESEFQTDCKKELKYLKIKN